MLAADMSSNGKDAMEPGFAAAEIDTSRPHPARMYNAYLSGNDNYPADRAAVRQILRDFPEVRGIALANRAFFQPGGAIPGRRGGHTAVHRHRHRHPVGRERARGRRAGRA